MTPHSPTAPKVTIGLPCYNRPRFLASAVASLQAQTCGSFELILSDNASPDPAMQALCEQLARDDPRIRYIRQPSNTGAATNFFAVQKMATAPYFMWAADDDLWPPAFIERGLASMEKNRRIGAFFCQLDVIDLNGDLWRRLPPFRRFASSGFRAADLVRFLREPEVQGKANLIYSLFRREALERAMPSILSLDYDAWGPDMAMVYAILCRTDWAIDESIALSKRHHTTEPPWEPADPRDHVFPLDGAAAYCENYVRASRGTPYGMLTRMVMNARWEAEVKRKQAVRP